MFGVTIEAVEGSNTVTSFNEQCDRFWFAFDINRDGLITITDVAGWIEYVAYLPALAAVWLIGEIPSAVTFFEMQCTTGTSWGGAIFSLMAWTTAIKSLFAYLEENFF